MIWDPAEGILNGIPFEEYTNAADPNWWVARAIDFPKDLETFVQELLTNPEALQSYFELVFFDYPEHIVQILQAVNRPRSYWGSRSVRPSPSWERSPAWRGFPAWPPSSLRRSPLSGATMLGGWPGSTLRHIHNKVCVNPGCFTALQATSCVDGLVFRATPDPGVFRRPIWLGTATCRPVMARSARTYLC